MSGDGVGDTQACDFCMDQGCSGHGICDPVTGACVCDSGFAGVFCSESAKCTSGIHDWSGKCCETLVDATGQCCVALTPLATPVLDQDGHCCASGIVDACGVCDGKGRYLDAVGVCCETTLDSNNRCCFSNFFDECGVCDGDDSSCGTIVTFAAQLSTSSSDSADVAALLYPQIVSTLGVDSSRVGIQWMTIDGQYAPLGDLVNPEARAVLAANGRRHLLQVSCPPSPGALN